MKLRIKKLPNNLTIMTVEMPDSTTTTCGIATCVGSDHETEKQNGLSHFLEHMLFKGTEKRPGRTIMREMDALGAESNAFTWYQFTAYYGKASSKNWRKVLDIVADMYQNPTFDQSELDKERGVIKGEIDMYEDLPTRSTYELLHEVMFDNQPAGRSVLGPKKNIEAFTREDFIEYHTNGYHAGNTIVVVAGDVSHKDVIKEVSEQFKSFKKTTRSQKSKTTIVKDGPKTKVRYKKTDQEHIAIGFHTCPAGHADEYVAEVVAGVLGQGMSSRLFEKLRDEMGAGYYVKASNASYSDRGIFEIKTGTEPARTTEIIEAIMNELLRLKDEPVDSKELKKSKEYLLGKHARDVESTDDIAFYYALQHCIHDKHDTVKQKTAAIKKVTAADIQNFAQKYFTNKNLYAACIGPRKNTQKLHDSVVL